MHDAPPSGGEGVSPEGLLVIDKPSGWTSHDVVARTRRLARTRRVGHAGTLDPMATGVLVLGVGRGTRLLGHLALHDKEYLATIRLGQSTVTDDAEGEVLADADASGVEAQALQAAVAALTGHISQRPSAVSAIKVGGKRAYARVRAGEAVELAARPVEVRAFEILDQRVIGSGPTRLLDLDVRVECSTGTYIRALARDLGAALGVGGHLTALRRTRVGGFALAESVTLEEAEAQGLPMLSLREAARKSFPVVDVDDEQATSVATGKRFALRLQPGPNALIDPAGRLLALAEPDPSGLIRYRAVLVP